MKLTYTKNSTLCLILSCGLSTPSFASTDDYPYHLDHDYQLVLDERFDSIEFDQQSWTAQTYGNGVGNAELQYYQPNNLSVSNGLLHIEAKEEARSDNTGWVPHQYTSGRLSTIGKKAFRYGKIAIRAKVPHQAGTHFAFWMGAADLNIKGFPQAGNMDIVQTGIYGQFKEVESHFQYAEPHTQLLNSTRFYHSSADFDASTDFHIYEIDWNADRVIYKVDGEITGTVTRTKDNQVSFDAHYYLAVNMGLQGPNSIYGGNQTFDYAGLHAVAEVDWIKVWQKPGDSDVKLNYGPTQPHTDIAGGNFVMRADNTSAIYRFAYTEGQLLAFWTPNINLKNPVDVSDPNYPLLPLRQALQADAYEGGTFMDYTINNTATGWSGGGWYSEYPINLTGFKDSILVFHLKSEFDLNFMNIGMIDSHGAQFETSALVNQSFTPDGQWHKIEIPLADFNENIDLSSLVYPLYIVTQEPANQGETIQYGIDNIYFKWQPDNTVIYPNPVDNTLAFSFSFSEPQEFLKLRLKVNGKRQPGIKMANVETTINDDGSVNYLWLSCLSYPKDSIIEAQIHGKNRSSKKDYFPHGRGNYSAPYTEARAALNTNNKRCHKP